MTNEKKDIARDLKDIVQNAHDLAEELGLRPYEVNYWIVDQSEMNELIAYDGFQTRYPHWRFGMKYDRQRKQRQFLGGKAFEIVNNDSPAAAFLQKSNSIADQKAVITHVTAHSDFFRNNQWFQTNPDAAEMLERNAKRVEDIMARSDVSREEVEEWIDHCLCIEDNIDQYTPFVGSGRDEQEEDMPDIEERVEEMDIDESVKREIFDDEFLDQEDDDEDGPIETDLLKFFLEHGKQYDEEEERAVPFEDWQQEILEIIREEAYYFAPQKMTKTMNEGWACVAPDTPVFTEKGVLPMEEVVENHTTVSDGENLQETYDSNIIRDHDTVTVETKRGYTLRGSNNHRVRQPDGSWTRLDELDVGDTIEISGGNGTWADEKATIDWTEPTANTAKTLQDVAKEAKVSYSTVMRYRELGRAEQEDAIEEALSEYEENPQRITKRQSISVPDTVTEPLGRLLGLFVGDGHVPSNSRHIGFTTEREEYAEEFAELAENLFGVEASVEKQGSRWRVYAHSKNLQDLFREEFEMPEGKAAERKIIPPHILRSPKSVVSAFIRGLFDADGYAGQQGAILSTKSEEIANDIQLLLTNFGIMTQKRQQNDGCYHVSMTGKSADIFRDEIGFGYQEKQSELDTYVENLEWFQTEEWNDEIVAIETGTGDVYDISVEETHRYAAAGFINHNSTWESRMMTDEGFAGDDEFIEYSDHMARVLGSPGFNPYKLGMELWEYIERKADRREVVENLLKVDGIKPSNFVGEVDFAKLKTLLSNPRSDKPWERHYSLTRPSNRGFIKQIPQEELEEVYRYLFDTTRFDTIEEAVEHVDHSVGWNRLFEERESNNDITFIDNYLDSEFLRDANYFTYEYDEEDGVYRAASLDPSDVKQKLLLRFTNFGKPTITVGDDNYKNKGYLLLRHEYNGIMLDLDKAQETLKRLFHLWGRPVYLKTIVKNIDDGEIEEEGRLISYDGDGVSVSQLDWEEVNDIAAEDIDYSTRPDEWTG